MSGSGNQSRQHRRVLVFGDRVIASAILDRILHHATTISIRGDSYRLKDKLKSGVVKPTTAAT